MSAERIHPEHHHAHIVVHPVEADAMAGPYRRVDTLGKYVGRAYKLADVSEFCQWAGLPELDLEVDSTVEWQGGGPATRSRPG